MIEGKSNLGYHIHFKPYVASGKNKNLKLHKKKKEVTHKFSMEKNVIGYKQYPSSKWLELLSKWLLFVP